MNRTVLITIVAALLLVSVISTSQATLMYATKGSAGELWTVDTNTAAATHIGGTPASSSTASAYIMDDNRIYAFNNADNALYSIDPSNGTGFVVGTLPYDSIQGFAYDPIHDILYGHDNDTGALFTIDTSNAGTTLIGNTGWGWLAGIDYDPVNDILYGFETGNWTGNGPRLGIINTTTAAVSIVGSIPDLISTINGALGFNPLDGMLYTSTEQSPAIYNLVRIDPTTLETTVVGDLPKAFSGLSVIVPEPAMVSLLGLGMTGLIARRKRK